MNNKFAIEQLKKFGWSEGEGLGKNKEGIKDAIKVGLKNNKHGLGHSEAFTSFWWEEELDRAAKDISIVKTKDGIKLLGTKPKEEDPPPVKKTKYSNFVKADAKDVSADPTQRSRPPKKSKKSSIKPHSIQLKRKYGMGISLRLQQADDELRRKLKMIP